MEFNNKLQPKPIQPVASSKLHPSWSVNGKQVDNFTPMTNAGPRDFNDKMWDSNGLNHIVWLREGKPEGIISDAKGQNFGFDDYQHDFGDNRIRFRNTDDGHIFFDADEELSPDEVFQLLQQIGKQSRYIRNHKGRTSK